MLRHATTIAFALAVAMLLAAGASAATDLPARLQPTRPGRPAYTAPPPVADPEVIRQGGDTIADAIAFSPLVDVRTGTTAGYTDDYDEVCPWPGSVAPDVVYSLENPFTIWLDIDLLGSSYDTKIYVYDEDLNLVACNDDFYGVEDGYVSRLPFFELIGGVTHYLVIDGYASEAGEYVVDINEVYVEILDCPFGSVLEGEPPLENGYVDDHNGGCGAPSVVSQPITADVFCGRSGWYQFEGMDFRDTDWFDVTLPATGVLTIVADAEQPTYLFELGPQDCSEVDVLQSVPFGPFSTGEMVLTGVPGENVWIWVGPQEFTPPGGDDVFEYTYVLWLDLPVAVQAASWSAVKALFD
jgi:hypothetical protein